MLSGEEGLIPHHGFALRGHQEAESRLASSPFSTCLVQLQRKGRAESEDVAPRAHRAQLLHLTDATPQTLLQQVRTPHPAAPHPRTTPQSSLIRQLSSDIGTVTLLLSHNEKASPRCRLLSCFPVPILSSWPSGEGFPTARLPPPSSSHFLSSGAAAHFHQEISVNLTPLLLQCSQAGKKQKRSKKKPSSSSDTLPRTRQQRALLCFRHHQPKTYCQDPQS